MSDPVTFRYTYTSKRDDKRYTARVRIHSRHLSEDGDHVILFLKPVGRWPDRPDLEELVDDADKKGVPVVKGVFLLCEDEAEWCTENLKAEGEWKG